MTKRESSKDELYDRLLESGLTREDLVQQLIRHFSTAELEEFCSSVLGEEDEEEEDIFEEEEDDEILFDEEEEEEESLELESASESAYQGAEEVAAGGEKTQPVFAGWTRLRCTNPACREERRHEYGYFSAEVTFDSDGVFMEDPKQIPLEQISCAVCGGEFAEDVGESE
jgi:hypothetical protein